MLALVCPIEKGQGPCHFLRLQVTSSLVHNSLGPHPLWFECVLKSLVLANLSLLRSGWTFSVLYEEPVFGIRLVLC